MKNNLLDYKIGQRGEREWMRDTQSYKTDKGVVNVYCFQPKQNHLSAQETVLSEDYIHCIHAKCA